MKTKLLIGVTSGVTGFLFLVALILTLTKIVETWKLFWIFAIIIGIIWGIVFTIYLINLGTTIDVNANSINDTEAIARFKEEVLEEDDNPDNLIPFKEPAIYRLGSPSKESSILVAGFIGTEMNQKRFLVQNLDNKKIRSKLTDPKPEEILEAMNLSPESPKDMIVEKIKQRFEFGQPTTEKEIKRSAEQKKEESEAI